MLLGGVQHKRICRTSGRNGINAANHYDLGLGPFEGRETAPRHLLGRQELHGLWFFQMGASLKEKPNRRKCGLQICVRVTCNEDSIVITMVTRSASQL